MSNLVAIRTDMESSFATLSTILCGRLICTTTLLIVSPADWSSVGPLTEFQIEVLQFCRARFLSSGELTLLVGIGSRLRLWPIRIGLGRSL